MSAELLGNISPIWIPVVSMAIPVVAILGGTFSQVQARRLKADQRMVLLSRGVPLAEIDAYMRSSEEAVDRGMRDPMRSLGNARRSAIVLVAVGIGLVIFSLLMEVILRERDVLVIGAAGMIPLAIGVGFAVDYRLQKREMARFGLELVEEKTRSIERA